MGANLLGAAASAWHAIRGMPYGDDDYETPGCPDDDDNDSNVGDADVMDNLALDMCAQVFDRYRSIRKDRQRRPAQR